MMGGERDEPGRRFPATPPDESYSPGTEIETFYFVKYLRSLIFS